MLEPEKIKQVLQLDDAQRAVYFVKEAVAQNELWILTDEHGCVMLNTEEEDCVPVWPHETFAKSWATGEWEGCKAKAIEVQKWLDDWTVGLLDDDLAVVVFPNENDEGVVVFADELDHELRQKSKPRR